MARLVPLLFAVLATALLFPGLVGGGHAATVSEDRQPTWTTAGALARPRAYGRAIAVETGEILVFGGLDPSDPHVTIPTSEVFDPITRKAALLPQLLLGRLNQGVTEAWAGRIVVTGGTEWASGSWASVSDVDVYLPWPHKWIRGAPMSQPRSDHGAVALADGRVLVTGGNYGSRILASSEIYDLATDLWTRAAPMPRPRTQFSIALLPTGMVLVAGGFEGDGRMTTSTLLYVPSTDTWLAGPEMREPRLNHSMVPLPDGDLLFFGGELPATGTAERFSWRDRAFVYAGVLGQPRLLAQGAALPDGRVVAMGGLPEARDRRVFDPTSYTEMWDPATQVWQDISAAPSKRAYAQIVVIGDGIYRLSGVGADEVPYATIEELTLN